MRSIVCVAVLTCTPLSAAPAQEAGPSAEEHTVASSPYRSPVAAGALSFLVPFGTGSYYAGNPVTGTIHLAVGVGTAALFMANFCLESCTDAQDTGLAIGFFGFVANWLAGTVVAVLDANAFNRRHRSPAVSVTPAVVVLNRPLEAQFAASAKRPIGVRLLQFRF